MTTQQLHAGFLVLQRRSEKAPPEVLRRTFVDQGLIVASIAGVDNQVLFGRRGTGKTHVLQYLSSTKREAGDISIYIDLSNLGSSGSVYADHSRSIPERATRLLVDMVLAIHNGILDAVTEDHATYDLSKYGPVLEALAHAATKVEVKGTVEEETQTALEETSGSSNKFAPSISVKGVLSAGEIAESASSVSKEQVRTKQSGVVSYVIHFGEMASALIEIEKLSKNRIWIMLDEWSNIPADLQPYLADLLRRTIFVRQKFTVKIGAIEYRSRFAIKESNNAYVGIELGADLAPSANLDDFLVFDNNVAAAAQFHKALLRNHLSEGPSAQYGVPEPNEIIKLGFSQDNVFTELVRAGEGVPRDFINILTKAALISSGEKISMAAVRRAALNWYQEGKASALRANQRATRLLEWIREEVIKRRKARAFLVQTDLESALLNELFDSRVLHLIKRSVSSNDSPGKRFDVFKLDFGCYVDLITSAAAPLGLFQEDEEGDNYLEVPKDDYRSIRRAILNLTEFERRHPVEP